MRAVASTSPFAILPLGDPRERLGRHPHGSARDAHPARDRLVGDVDHAGATLRIEVAQLAHARALPVPASRCSKNEATSASTSR